MSSPTARKDSNSPPTSRRLRLRKPPLLLRRLGAWVVEVTLISSSAIAPYAMGEYARTHSETQVPLNPVLSATQDNIAQTLAIPITQSDRTVAPITNLLWSVALAAPIAVTAWQLYLLGSTGKTSPKRWFGVRVIGANGAPPGVVRAFVREAVGRWGLPLGIAYSIWRYSGAFPDLGVLAGLAGFFLLAECASSRFNRHHRAFHDRLAGTFCAFGKPTKRERNPFFSRSRRNPYSSGNCPHPRSHSAAQQLVVLDARTSGFNATHRPPHFSECHFRHICGNPNLYPNPSQPPRISATG
ncbi:RDD family protein [Geitlerinema splendidum]|nr:RDD family protein [Geitlerinema splendidum]